MKNPSNQLAGPQDPFRDDLIARIGYDGMTNGLYSRVKMILSNDRQHEVFEILDDSNRTLYIVKAGRGWQEVELDD